MKRQIKFILVRLTTGILQIFVNDRLLIKIVSIDIYPLQYLLSLLNAISINAGAKIFTRSGT